MKEIFSGDNSADVQHIGESVSVEDNMNSAFLETPLDWLREENFEKLTNQIESMNFLSDEEKQKFKEKAAKAGKAKIADSLKYTIISENDTDKEGNIEVSELEQIEFPKLLESLGAVAVRKLVEVDNELKSIYTTKSAQEINTLKEEINVFLLKNEILNNLVNTITRAELVFSDEFEEEM